jgi:hypothetical protein
VPPLLNLVTSPRSHVLYFPGSDIQHFIWHSHYLKVATIFHSLSSFRFVSVPTVVLIPQLFPFSQYNVLCVIYYTNNNSSVDAALIKSSAKFLSQISICLHHYIFLFQSTFFLKLNFYLFYSPLTHFLPFLIMFYRLFSADIIKWRDYK